jgi:hypothetical protein
LSFYTLRDEYNIDIEKTVKWTTFQGVSNEFTFLESIYRGVSNAFTFTWNILFYVSKEFTFLWDIWSYISREFTFLYRMAMDFGGKVKYSFRKSAIVNRFFKRERNG